MPWCLSLRAFFLWARAACGWVQAFRPSLRPNQCLFSRHPPLSQSPAPSGALGAAHSGCEPPARLLPPGRLCPLPIRRRWSVCLSLSLSLSCAAAKLPSAAEASAPLRLCAALPHARPSPPWRVACYASSRGTWSCSTESFKKHYAAAILTLWDYFLAKWDGEIR